MTVLSRGGLATAARDQASPKSGRAGGPPTPLISQLSDELVKHGPRGRFQRIATRCLDILFASIGILLASPFMLLAALWVAVDSPGPVLFRQERVGRGGRSFTMLKFRSMRTDADENVHKEYVQKIYTEGATTVAAKLHNDDRVTKSGKLLRKTSLDELPQLFNILGGSMSLVGPRPVLPYEVEVMGPENLDRFAVKPGLTGPWQVHGRGRTTFLEMMEFDVRYARQATVLTDLGLIVRTPVAVLSGKGAK
ncbi:sugar transferase [Fodinicola acaciae]|uniref:sugar transferase n=1 Tax=Fodinicola acaciae TaxID=2681555 RepID=UPI001C9E8129|nr:sugar transferase [Fodinicola acaciae]